MRRLAARLVGLYPRWWRDRYEPEVLVLLEEHPVRLTTLADLLAGAVGARLDSTPRSEEEAMARTARPGHEHMRCSFCGKAHDQVKRLVSGPGVYICDACVGLCNEVLASDDGPRCEPPPPVRPPPRCGPRTGVRTWLGNLFHSAAPQTA